MIRVLLLLCLAVPVLAQEKPAPAKPKFLYGHDVKVRNVDEKNFTEKTPKVGVEVFHDTVGGALIAISESGHIAVIPYASASESKKADWIAAFELRVRDASVASFKDSKKIAAETFKDLGSGKILTITSQRTLAWSDAPASINSAKEPELHHGLMVKVRAPGENDFKAAKALGLEVFKDGTIGNLVYLSDQGFIATAAAPATAPNLDAVKPPKGLYGFPLYSRKADEGDFTKDTKMVGIEVLGDPNSGATLFVSEAGSIATLAGETAKPEKPAKPVWQRGFVLKARKGGEKEFDKAAKYGVEVFEDQNAKATIYISETGSIAVMKK